MATETPLPIVLYDGTCRFCIAQARRLKKLTRGRVRFMCSLDDRPNEIKFIDADGTTVGGAAAIARILRVAGGPLGAVARIYSVWPCGVIADAAYRFVAKRRSSGSCSPGARPPIG